MKERARNILVGITALVGLVGLGVMLTLFGSLSSFFEKGYVITIDFENARRLSAGSRVTLNGTDVGTILDVTVHYAGEAKGSHTQGGTPEAGAGGDAAGGGKAAATGPAEQEVPAKAGVTVRAKINQGVVLRDGVRATINSPLVGGGPSVELDISGVAPGALQLADGAHLTGDSSTLMDGLAHRFDELKNALAKFDRLNDNFETLSKEWTKVGHNINVLTETVSPEDLNNGKAQGKLASVLAHADQRLVELKATLAEMQVWVGDKKLHTDLSETLAHAKSVSEKLDKTADKIDQTVANSRDSIDKLSKRYVAVADDLSAAIASARQAIDQARTGDGTVGRLMKDPKLYDNLNDSVQRVDQAMKDFKLLIDKFRDEGIMLNMGGG